MFNSLNERFYIICNLVLLTSLLVSFSCFNFVSVKGIQIEDTLKYSSNSFDHTKWRFSDLKLVSSESSSISIDSSIVIDSTDNLHVTWTD